MDALLLARGESDMWNKACLSQLDRYQQQLELGDNVMYKM